MRSSKMRILTVLALPILYVSGCTYISHNGNSAFDTIDIGDTEAIVINKFGTEPSMREKQGTSYRRYATNHCQSPCTERLWYENSMSLLDEAWSIEIDQNGKVIDKARWVSP